MANRFSDSTLRLLGGDNLIYADDKFFGDRDTFTIQFLEPLPVPLPNPAPIRTGYNLTGATINAYIKRRQLLGDITESKATGLISLPNFGPYPTNFIITTASAVVMDNSIAVADTSQLFVGKPIQFWGNVPAPLVAEQTYYILSIRQQQYITITATQGSTTPVVIPGALNLNFQVAHVKPVAINLPITIIDETNGIVTMSIDDSMWQIMADDPDLVIDLERPCLFTGKVYLSTTNWSRSYQIAFLIRNDGVM